MATDYENFMKAAVAIRPEAIKGEVEATGDPRTSLLTKVQNAPLTTIYHQHGTIDRWERVGPNPTDWVKRPNGRTSPPFIIRVNPTTGNDDVTNDGQITPVATIPAALARIGADTANGLIILSAGVHELGGIGDRLHLPRGWAINGWYDEEFGTNENAWGWPHIADFEVLSGSGWTISKDPGTTAWTIDALVGKFLYSSHYGWYYYYPIIANTAHTITVANFQSDVDVGSAAFVVEPQSTISNTGGFTYFDCQNAPGQLWGLKFVNANCNLRKSARGGVQLCSFTNNSGPGLQLGEGTYAIVSECYFGNNGYEGVYSNDQVAEVTGCAFNTNAQGGVKFATYQYAYASYLAFRGLATNRYGIIIAGALDAEVTGSYYFNSVGRFLNVATPNSNVYFTGDVTPVETTKPTTYGIVTAAGSTIYLRSTYAIDCTTAASAFSVNARTVPLADMVGKYGRNFFAPGNTRVLSF